MAVGPGPGDCPTVRGTRICPNRPPGGEGEGGIRGVCLLQFVPGLPDVEPPPPRPAAGAAILVRPAKGGKPLAQAKADRAGKFRIPLPPGEYLVEASPRPGMRRAARAPAPVRVTVARGKFAEAKFTLLLLGS